MSEKFCLKWNDFHSNVSKSFGLLRNEEYLHDVTLVADDHKQISAHKLVLSACSEYFKNIFQNIRKFPYQHPLICLSGVSSSDLNDILNYIYEGEVQIYQDNLDRFLHIAQRLNLDGLLLANEDNAKLDYLNDKPSNIMNESKPNTDCDVGNRIKSEPGDIQMKTNGTVPVSSDDMSIINEQINELITRDEETKNYKCNVCGKCANAKQHIKYHVETHLDGLEFPCQSCDKIFKTSISFRMHNFRNHKSNF